VPGAAQGLMVRPNPTFDLMQPLLFLSVISSILLAFSLYFALKVMKVRDPKFISVLYLMPMFVPIVIYAISFPPSFLFPTFRTFTLLPQLKEEIIYEGILIRDAILRIPDTQYIYMSATFCLTGLSLGSALLAFLYVFGSRIVCRLQEVVELMPQENPDLLAMIRRLAERAGISMPRIGINEDLRPNAFTIGWGKKAMIVVTLGLLKTLDGTELEAVLAHEIAHIKNQDFHFMALISSLKAISFFNPLVYILSPAIKKERELLADDTGTKLLERPEAFGLALSKIWDASKVVRAKSPSRGFLRQWVTGIFIISEIKNARSFLITHPTLELRLTNIAESRIRTRVSKGEILRTILICGVVMSVVACAFGLVIQTYFSGRRMNGTFGPERIWYRSINVPANQLTFELGPYHPYPAMILNSRGRVNLNYPWALNTIYMFVILTIMLKIWRPSIASPSDSPF